MWSEFYERQAHRLRRNRRYRIEIMKCPNCKKTMHSSLVECPHCRFDRVLESAPTTAEFAVQRMVGRRFTRVSDNAQARIVAEAEGYVMGRYKGAAMWVKGRAEFLKTHVEMTPETPNDEALRPADKGGSDGR